jgi:hypothetical protein
VYLVVIHTTMLVHMVLRFALLLVLRTVCGSTRQLYIDSIDDWQTVRCTEVAAALQKYIGSTRRYPADVHMCMLHAPCMMPLWQ